MNFGTFFAWTLSLIYEKTTKSYIILWLVDPRQQPDTPTTTCSLFHLLHQDRGQNRRRERRNTSGTKTQFINVRRIVGGFAKENLTTSRWMFILWAMEIEEEKTATLLTLIYCWIIWYGIFVWMICSPLFSFPFPIPLWVGFLISQYFFSFIFRPTHEHPYLFLLGLKKSIQLAYSLFIKAP